MSAGATLRSGTSLVVQGVASGHFTIESEACLMVQGVLSGTFDNDGTVIVAGVLQAALPGTGAVAVAAGTILAAYGPSILRPDGTLELIPAGGSNLDVNVDGNVAGHLAYNHIDGTFRPLGGRED
ncbi:MAG: hypothetical protein ACYCSF_12105 [Acidimicrobiales bacterium]